MTATDRAILIAVCYYPKFNDLQGPRQDAKDFLKWLLLPDGGNLKRSQIKLIRSPPRPSEPFPLVAHVEKAFDCLYDEAEANHKKGEGFRVGRRLYLYCSGHGFDGDLGAGATSLLMSDADPGRPRNIVGSAYGEWFRQAALFDEILLFMDCCRTHMPLWPQSPPHFSQRVNKTKMETVRSFYGFAARWSQETHEWAIPPGGRVRGAFTAALLGGLRGEAADAEGNVTAASLGAYLNDEMHRYLPPLGNAGPRRRWQPDHDARPQGEAHRFQIVTGIPQARVEVRLDGDPTGLEVQLRGPRLNSIPAAQAGPPVWSFDKLERGLYGVRTITIATGAVHQERLIEVRMGDTISCRM